MIVLESLKALQGYDTITIGHDTPVHRQGDPCGFGRRENLQREPKSHFPGSAAARLARFLRRASLSRAPLNGASQRSLGGLGKISACEARRAITAPVEQIQGK